MSAKRHKHTFTALYYHLGQYGPQGCHVHACFDEDCDRALVGTGRVCKGSTHRRDTLPVGPKEER